MPYKTSYFNQEELAFLKSKPEGYLRRLVQKDMTPERVKKPKEKK